MSGMKCVKNFMNGWSGESLKPLTEKSLNKLKGTWAEVLNADDYIKPMFDIDLKVLHFSKDEQVDYDKWIIPIRHFLYSAMAEKVGEDDAELLCASSSGWNEEKKSHYISLHITFPRLKILFKNMPQLVEDLDLGETQVFQPDLNSDFKVRFDVDRAIYGKERQCIRLINQDKPIKGGGRAGRKKVKHLEAGEVEKPDWDYVIGNVAPDARELEYIAPVIKRCESSTNVSAGASIKWSNHHLDQWVKSKFPDIVKRTECESCVYYDFDCSIEKNRFCEFKMNDSQRNHGNPEGHAVFGNYIMWSKQSGRVFRRCRCPDGTCPSSSRELTEWRDMGLWERIYKEKGEDAMVECMNETLAHLRFEDGKQTYIINYKSIKDIQEIDKTNLSECFADEGWDEVGPNGGTKRMDPVKIWRLNRKHLKLNKRIFDPSASLITDEGDLNLWKGFNLDLSHCVNFIRHKDYGEDKAREEWNFYKNHIEEHLCQGDLDLSNYVLNWMSHILQKPNKKTEVMLVIKGPEGVGKSAVFAKDSQFQKIIAESCKYGPFYQISETNRLFSRFNDRLKDVRYLVLNEALFAGDKKTLSQLKELITDPIITTEKKFGNAVNLDQFFDMVSITNYHRASPFTTSSRRWQGVECGNKLSKEGKSKAEKAEISKYFRRFWSIPPQVVGYYLYTRDISGFNPPNDIVYNKFMVEQSEYGRDIVEKFVIAMADTGYIRYRGQVDYGGGLTTAWIPNFLFILMDCKTLFACFEAYKKSVGYTDRYTEVSENTLISQIKSILTPRLFQVKSMDDKGLMGFSGRGIVATREYLNKKYKIEDSGIGWSNDLTYSSGCYKKYYGFIKIDNLSDVMRVKGGTLKNKERRVFHYSTFDEDGDDERVRLKLINRQVYQFRREGVWVNYNKRGSMISEDSPCLSVGLHWKMKSLDNLTYDEYSKLKVIKAEGEEFGVPSRDDLYDSDIDEEELDKEIQKEKSGEAKADIEAVLEQKHQEGDLVKEVKEVVAKGQESESDEDDYEIDSD